MPTKAKPNLEPIDPSLAVLTEPEAARYLRIALITLKRMRARGTAPKVVHLTKRRLGYRKVSLDAWLAERETAA